MSDPERPLCNVSLYRRSAEGKLASAERKPPRLLVFIVAYHAETTIKAVLARIPAHLSEDYETEVLIIDDASRDRTFEHGREVRGEGSYPFPLTVLFNPVNQGYGGNQKIGYHYAIEREFDFVALLHGDGQYAPECLPDLVRPLREGRADACFGSRFMIKGGARNGGMPLYKFVGNRILSWYENCLLGTDLSEFHSGYRVYSVAALRKVPFEFNTTDFHFDTEIIVQFARAGLRVIEQPIPTYYGDEICRVNGIKYAWNVVRAVTIAKAQELGLFYDRRFDCAPPGRGNEQYQPKLDYESPHSLAFEAISPQSRVLDLGCAGGYMGAVLKSKKGCTVVGVDLFPLAPGIALDSFHHFDLNEGMPELFERPFDYVLLLDVIEHLATPEHFVQKLRSAVKYAPDTRIIVSTGNIGFFITRIMLLLGHFNYGKRGILDMTHTRLFTFSSLRQLFEQGGYRVVENRGIPAPFPLALGKSRVSRMLMRLNRFLIRISRGMFSYQMFFVVQPRPSLELLLRDAKEQSAARLKRIEESAHI